MRNVWEFLRDNRFAAQVWKTYGSIVRGLFQGMELVRLRPTPDQNDRDPPMDDSLSGLV
jgi:hypothetical protein